MLKKFIAITAAAAVLAGGTAFAATTAGKPGLPQGLIVSPDGRQISVTQPERRNAHVQGQSFEVPGDKHAIFDNLSEKYPDGTYLCCQTWYVGGPQGALGQDWVGLAFTPKANTTADTVVVGLGYIQGTNSIVVTLNSDNAGQPGAALATSTVSNMPPIGVCCTLTSASLSGGVPLTAGTQYWVVLQTNDSDPDASTGWNFNDTEQVIGQTGAYNQGSGWVTGAYIPAPALAVLGPK
jgi:hypothetical protein